jgi:hypothetical protein
MASTPVDDKPKGRLSAFLGRIRPKDKAKTSSATNVVTDAGVKAQTDALTLAPPPLPPPERKNTNDGATGVDANKNEKPDEKNTSAETDEKLPPSVRPDELPSGARPARLPPLASSEENKHDPGGGTDADKSKDVDAGVTDASPKTTSVVTDGGVKDAPDEKLPPSDRPDELPPGVRPARLLPLAPSERNKDDSGGGTDADKSIRDVDAGGTDASPEDVDVTLDDGCVEDEKGALPEGCAPPEEKKKSLFGGISESFGKARNALAEMKDRVPKFEPKPREEPPEGKNDKDDAVWHWVSVLNLLALMGTSIWVANENLRDDRPFIFTTRVPFWLPSAVLVALSLSIWFGTRYFCERGTPTGVKYVLWCAFFLLVIVTCLLLPLLKTITILVICVVRQARWERAVKIAEENGGDELRNHILSICYVCLNAMGFMCTLYVYVGRYRREWLQAMWPMQHLLVADCRP